MQYLALERGIGRLEEGAAVALLDVEVTLADHLAGGGRLADLDTAGIAGRMALDDVALASPVRPSAATWGIGLNYRSKQESTGRSLPSLPTLFSKAASAAVDPGAPIRIPASAPDCVDYEGEIAVILSAALFEAGSDEAVAAVGAVAAANDVTARDVMRATGNPSLAKSYPGFGQLGAAVVDPRAAGGFESLTLTTRVNGEVRQSDSGSGLIYSIGELLALLCRHVLLRPGDVVLTGTPAGTGDETGSYLTAGDTVEVEVAGLPALRSPVVDDRAGHSG